MVAQNQPTILYGLKGFTGIEINVTGPDHDLHSGMYGGAVRNPAIALSHILASMKNEEEVVTVDGFYDDVEPLSDHERELIAKVEGEDYRESTGATETVSEKGYTAKEHTMARPTLKLTVFSAAIREKERKRLFHHRRVQKSHAGLSLVRIRNIFSRCWRSMCTKQRHPVSRSM